MIRTFKCNFGKDVGCSVEIDDTPPAVTSEYSQMAARKVEWTGKPTAAVMRPYVGWMNSVNQQMANEWGRKLMHVFMFDKLGQSFEIWAYEPHVPAILVARHNVPGLPDKKPTREKR
ncbi:MAG TPA: hypothetical protein VFU31_21190 [Candidatus Binatia bacterium]|nr:hypothetical protein [Candidatus Binatia bacterium]